jgi:hypothetical protein
MQYLDALDSKEVAALGERWELLMGILEKEFGRRPNMEALLFLIGVQEIGAGKQTYTKEEKQDLMHIAMCALLSRAGYYELEGKDKEGWPHWKLIQPLPAINIFEQITFLRGLIIDYFESVYSI